MQGQGIALTPTSRLITALTPGRLCMGNPLCKFFVKIARRGLWGIFLISGTLSSFGFLVIGGIVSTFYEGPVDDYLSLWDYRELLWNTLISWLYNPLTWLAYAWQPWAAANVLRTLNANGILKEDPQPRRRHANLLVNPVFNTIILVVALIAAGLAAWVWWSSGPGCPAGPWCYGKSKRWLTEHLWYLLLVWSPLVYVNIYMIVWLIARQLIIWVIFIRLFQTHELEPQLYHKDGRNGLASMGQFIIGSTAIAVFQAFWVSMLTLWPAFFGSMVTISNALLIIDLVYIVYVPFFLLPTLLLVRRALVRSKEQHLHEIGEQIRAELDKTDPTEIIKSKELVDALIKRQEMIVQEHRTLPFRNRGITFLGILAVLAFIINAAVAINDLFFN